MLARLIAFVRLSRLKFLGGGVAGGALGTAFAVFESGRIDWAAYAVAQGTITAFHLMTHYANEYFDRRSDALTVPTPYSGGSGVLRAGLLAPVVALIAALACAAAGVAGTFVLAVAVRQPAAAGIAVAIGLLAWFYSAPPLRLCARGLGEAATAVVVGCCVPLCAFAAQHGAPDAFAVLVTLPGTAAMFAMMLAVEFPDVAADRAAGKRNLVVRLTPRESRLLGLTALAAVYAAVAAAVVAGAPPAYGLFEALGLPLAAGYARALLTVPSGEAIPYEGLAARGVALFFLVTFYGALAYATAIATHSRV